MKATVTKFKDYAKATPVRADLPEHSVVVLLPTIRVERYGGAERRASSIKTIPIRTVPKQRVGSIAGRRARNNLEEQSRTVENCLMWLAKVAESNPDPRAITELIGQVHDEELDSAEACGIPARPLVGNINVTMAWLARFAEAWNRRMMRRTKPRLIDDPEPV